MANTFKAPSILYFIKGSVAQAEHYADAMKFGPGVKFRNGNMVPHDASPGSVEPCDGVAGDIPPAYRKFPHALDVIKNWTIATVHAAEAAVKAAPVVVPKAVKQAAPVIPAAREPKAAIDFTAATGGAVLPGGGMAPVVATVAPVVPETPPTAPLPGSGEPSAAPAPAAPAAPGPGWTANPPTQAPSA